MADKVRINTEFLVTSGPNTNNPSDISKLGFSFEKEIQESVRMKLKLDVSEVLEVSLPAASCDFIAVYADQNLEIDFTGTDDFELFTSIKPGIRAPILMRAKPFTALSFSNPSTTKTVNLDVFIIKI